MKAFKLVLGVLVLTLGLVWIAQGANVLVWPSESFMVGEPVWILWGAGIAIVGVLLILRSRR